jgi:hypothetical protein
MGAAVSETRGAVANAFPFVLESTGLRWCLGRQSQAPAAVKKARVPRLQWSAWSRERSCAGVKGSQVRAGAQALERNSSKVECTLVAVRLVFLRGMPFKRRSWWNALARGFPSTFREHSATQWVHVEESRRGSSRFEISKWRDLHSKPLGHRERRIHLRL